MQQISRIKGFIYSVSSAALVMLLVPLSRVTSLRQADIPLSEFKRTKVDPNQFATTKSTVQHLCKTNMRANLFLGASGVIPIQMI